jgi:hypothetical protein
MSQLSDFAAQSAARCVMAGCPMCGSGCITAWNAEEFTRDKHSRAEQIWVKMGARHCGADWPTWSTTARPIGELCGVCARIQNGHAAMAHALVR